VERIDWPVTDPINTVIVTNANNGLILTRFIDVSTTDNVEYEVATDVFEAKSWGLDEPDLECVIDFLWALLDALSIYT